jgi:hypothetical protein
MKHFCSVEIFRTKKNRKIVDQHKLASELISKIIYNFKPFLNLKNILKVKKFSTFHIQKRLLVFIFHTQKTQIQNPNLQKFHKKLKHKIQTSKNSTKNQKENQKCTLLPTSFTQQKHCPNDNSDKRPKIALFSPPQGGPIPRVLSGRKNKRKRPPFCGGVFSPPFFPPQCVLLHEQLSK